MAPLLENLRNLVWNNPELKKFSCENLLRNIINSQHNNIEKLLWSSINTGFAKF